MKIIRKSTLDNLTIAMKDGTSYEYSGLEWLEYVIEDGMLAVTGYGLTSGRTILVVSVNDVKAITIG